MLAPVPVVEQSGYTVAEPPLLASVLSPMMLFLTMVSVVLKM